MTNLRNVENYNGYFRKFEFPALFESITKTNFGRKNSNYVIPNSIDNIRKIESHSRKFKNLNFPHFSEASKKVRENLN